MNRERLERINDGDLYLHTLTGQVITASSEEIPLRKETHMLTFLQQSQTNRNTFAVTKEPEKASHFRDEDGDLHPISELNLQLELESEQEQNEALTDELEETLNEAAQWEKQVSAKDANELITQVGTKRPQKGEGPLDLATLNFGEEEGQGQKEKETVDNDVLDLPVTDFSRVTHQASEQEVKLHKAGAAAEEEQAEQEGLADPEW